MRAVQITQFGGPEVLALAEVPKPVPGRGQVLIRVAAAGINFAETLMREDCYVASYSLPATPGSEVAGTVEAVGAEVEGLAPGQRVGALLVAARVFTGGYAEYAVADAAVTVPLPDGVEFAEATALLVQGLTALYLVEEVDPAGRDVLVTAAGGGVGLLLLQLARRAGARSVTAVASNAEKRAAALALGADEARDYADWACLAPNLIYDSVGAELLPKCLETLGFKGVLVTFGALSLRSFALGVDDLKRMIFANQSLRGFAFGPLLEPERMKRDLVTLFGLAASGELKVVVGGRYPLDRAAEAHRALADRATVGKLVIEPGARSEAPSVPSSSPTPRG